MKKVSFNVLIMAVLLVLVISTPGTKAEKLQIERRVNIPYQQDGSWNPAIFWFGQVTPTINNADVRLYYYDDFMQVVVHIIDRRLWYDESPTPETLEEWDAVSLFLNMDGNIGASPSTSAYRLVSGLWGGAGRQAAYKGNGTAWMDISVPFSAEASYRSSNGPNSDSDDKGWQLTYTIPFANLGLETHPAEGTTWGLAVAVHDRDEADGSPAIADQVWPETADANVPSTWGEMRFGIPTYNTPTVQQQGITTIRHGLNGAHVADGHVGGHTTCGDGLDHWTEWGEANYAGYNQINIQNQWDISDYPCFSKYFVTFPLTELPPDKIILQATLTMTLFGNAGGGEWGVPEDSYIVVSTVAEDWDEQTLNWNNAPLALENISGTWVMPVQTSDQRIYDWDVSRAVADAYHTGNPLRLALYSTDGERHSGKYFWSSDVDDYDAVMRPTLTVLWGSTASVATQEIPLSAGWNMISSHVDPLNPALGTLLAAIDSDMVIMKNGAGQVYWPEYSINEIGDWNLRDGYKIYMNQPAAISFMGYETDPTNVPFDLPAGWSMISYLRVAPMPANQALAFISGQLVLVKHSLGQVYWPSMGINQIGDLVPGQGYHIYLHSPGTLTYPAN